MSRPAIIVNNLVKSYDKEEVIKGITFRVNYGEIFGFLGVNGAGKTTTLECIEGLLNYNRGDIKVTGKLGVQLQSSALLEHMKVKETLKLFSLWNNNYNYSVLIKSLNLEELLNKKYKQLSAGQARRLSLALALIGNPDIVLLDEPSAGLDVESRASLHDYLRNLKDEGKAIIITSHDMTEIENLCHKIAILKEGRLAFQGSPQEIGNNNNKKIIICVKTNDKKTIDNLTKSTFSGVEKGYLHFNAENLTDAMLEILTEASNQNIEIYDIKTKNTTLEEEFLTIAREKVL